MSAEPQKSLEFESLFTLLGFEVNLRKVVEGEVSVANRVSKTKSVLRAVKAALEDSRLTPAEAASLAGRVQDLQSAHLGACAGLALRALRGRAAASGSVRLDGYLRVALGWLERYCATLVVGS